MKVTAIEAFPIFDSRGMPTLEVELTLENGAKGRGLVPSGASTGQFEALELRDGDPSRFRGRSVFQAISAVNGEIRQALLGTDGLNQEAIDQAMISLDGTASKSRLGANAILGVSMAAAEAAAAARMLPLYASLGAGQGTLLPLPEIQIIGGGAHAHWRTDVQDFMVIATGATTYAETLEITFDVFHAAGEILRERGILSGCADEGGYWPEFDSNEGAFAVLLAAIERAGYVPGREVALSLDIAASDLFDPEEGVYRFRLEERTFSRAEFVALILDWCQRYPIVSLEDPAADTDWESWLQIRAGLPPGVQLVGDDLFTTNLARIREGIERKAANSVLIKLNQIGTVTETLEAIHVTREAGWLPLVSARSGETESAFISHLAVASNAGQLKVGSFCRGERMVKWNECLRIERHLGSAATFMGARLYDRLTEAD